MVITHRYARPHQPSGHSVDTDATGIKNIPGTQEISFQKPGGDGIFLLMEFS
jgi:hypothetical protein